MRWEHYSVSLIVPTMNPVTLADCIITPADELNTGTFEWTIGENDNIDDEVIKESPNFVLLIRDPSGQTTDGGGFVNGQLSSRAFIIKSNQTASSTTSQSAASTTAESLPTNSPPASPTSSEPSEENAVGGLSTGAKAGIGAGVGAAALIAIVAGIWLGVRRWRGARQKRVGTPPQMSSRYEVEGSTDFYNSHGRPFEIGHKPAQDRAIELPAPGARGSGGVHEIGDGR
jgi:hypothetical protein